MEIKFDLHTHTIYTGHAYSTVYENVLGAKKSGLIGIAITDHGPALTDAGHDWHFSCLKPTLPPVIEGIRVIPGIEANIINDKGELDVSEDILKSLDVVIASLHGDVYFPRDEKELFKMYEAVVKSPYVNILGHPDRCKFQFDIERFVKLAKEYDKPVELNQHSLEINSFYTRLATDLAKACNKYKAEVVVNTDSHFFTKVGDFGLSEKMLTEIGFDNDLIINCDYDKTIEMFGGR